MIKASEKVIAYMNENVLRDDYTFVDGIVEMGAAAPIFLLFYYVCKSWIYKDFMVQ